MLRQAQALPPALLVQVAGVVVGALLGCPLHLHLGLLLLLQVMRLQTASLRQPRVMLLLWLLLQGQQGSQRGCGCRSCRSPQADHLVGRWWWPVLPQQGSGPAAAAVRFGTDPGLLCCCRAAQQRHPWPHDGQHQRRAAVLMQAGLGHLCRPRLPRARQLGAQVNSLKSKLHHGMHAAGLESS